MTGVAKALSKFCSGFGIPAYVEDSVPLSAQLPYLTYSVVVPDWDNQATFQMRLWYKGTSFTSINAKIDEISKKIGGGIRVHSDGGFIVVRKDNNFAQFQPYNDQGQSNIKVAYLSMLIDTYI